jgi:hypothetical protein
LSTVLFNSNLRENGGARDRELSVILIAQR